MPGNPSFYFSLFKKFQVLNHVPTQSVHGNAGAPSAGFNLADPNAAGVFGTSNRGKPLADGDHVPANVPLWAILNARATGSAAFALVPIPGGTQAGSSWPAMPTGPVASGAFGEFQTNAPTKIVDVFGTWIMNGQVNDVPTGVVAARPPSPIGGPLDAGKALFVCSMPGDNGVRPGAVPSDFWATSLIFLVNPANGNTVTPTTLTAASEYYLAAVIGNRGNTAAGRYLNNPPSVEAAASVMVWNTFDSPGVELPSLSNLDVNSTSGIYEQYFLRSGEYDVAGWRLNVQTVFNGIIAALNDAVTNHGLNLGGQTPEQWVLTQPAHLCAKVVIRGETNGQAFPNFGTDTPITNRRIAQKNLAPFEVGITTTDPNPNIIWKNFIVGQPLFYKFNRKDAKNLLVLNHGLPAKVTQVFLAMPMKTFEEFVRKAGALAGFDVVPEATLPQVGLHHGKPFPDAVILRQKAKDATIQFPFLDEKQYLGMAVGVEYDMKKIKHGPLGNLTMVQHSIVPVLQPGTHCFDLVEQVVGGFTLQVHATDPHAGPKGRIDYADN